MTADHVCPAELARRGTFPCGWSLHLTTAKDARAGHRPRRTTSIPPALRPIRELQLLIEGLALKRPPPSIATIHRDVTAVAQERSWPVPSYATVHDVVRHLDPALVVLAHDGTRRYEELYDLVYRREASKPNEIWQADHTQLDLWVITPSGPSACPWLTIIEDDHSRAIAGYGLNLGAPSALTTALAFRQAIWRKEHHPVRCRCLALPSGRRSSGLDGAEGGVHDLVQPRGVRAAPVDPAAGGAGGEGPVGAAGPGLELVLDVELAGRS